MALLLSACLYAPAEAFAQTASPGFVYAEAIRGHIVVVNWEPTTTSGTITYNIYRAQGPTIPGTFPGGWAQVGSVAGQTMQSWVDTQTKATSTRYWYAVTAKSSTDTESNPSPLPLSMGGNGLDTRYQPVATANMYQWYIGPTTGVPVEVSNIEITGADTTATITWDALPSSNVSFYRIFRSEESGVDGAEIGVVPSTETTYTDVTIEKYHHYWYTVVAEDSLGATGFPSVEKHFRSVASTSPAAPHGGSSPPPGSDTCMTCHDPHVAAAPKLLCVGEEGSQETALCLSCHDGTGSMYDIRREFTDHNTSSHDMTITAGDGSVETSGTFCCSDCHTPHGDPDAEGSRKLLLVDGATSGNEVCYGAGCHGGTSPGHWAGDLSAFESSVHSTGIPDPESGTGVKCSTCHMPHASPNEALWVSTSYRACLECHSSENVSLTSPDIYTRMTMNQDNDSHHDVLPRDQEANGTFIACQNCHNTHLLNSDNPLVDPENPSMTGQWPEGPATALTVSGGSATDPRYNSFCLTCHDLSMPTATQTAGWVDPPDDNGVLAVDISDVYANNNAHGALAAGGTPILNPASGYAYDDTLACIVCHEPHGTINNYNLRCDVRGADGTVLATARMLVPRLDSSGVPTGDYDTRFFCMSCHLQQATNPPNHNSTNQNQPKTFYFFPTTCTASACHQHNTTTPRRF